MVETRYTRGVRENGASSYAWVKLVVVILSLAVLLCLVAFLIVTFLDDIRNLFRGKQEKAILIFAATTFFKANITDETYLGNCSSTREWCRITNDIAELPNASAIVIHNRDKLEAAEILETLQPNSTMPVVLFSLESPTYDAFKFEPNVINFTMTYRRDANVWYPYGQMKKLSEPKEVDFEAIWSVKTKTAAWLASNCETRNKRRELIDALEKEGVQIDRWGGCGTPPPDCGIEKQYDHCVVDLIMPYKFYIAYENSNCKDYVTEKFYRTVGERFAVPIVIHRLTYQELGIPERSFIALDDFDSMKEMADFINDVANNKTAYLEYHEWRTDYEVKLDVDEDTGFCGLCRKLQDETWHGEYPNVGEWHSKNMCNNEKAFEHFLKSSTEPAL